MRDFTGPNKSRGKQKTAERNPSSDWTSREFLHIVSVMGECLKRAWIGYKKYKLVTRIIAAFVGAIVGISGCVVFVKIYQNYNAAVWAAVSALLAIVFLHLNFAVRRDHERLISSQKFTVIMYIGACGLLAGLIGFITSIVLGITHHESGKAHTFDMRIKCKRQLSGSVCVIFILSHDYAPFTTYFIWHMHRCKCCFVFV